MRTAGDVDPARKIKYPGTGNYSTFAYDGNGDRIKIVESLGGTISSTKQFIWSQDRLCESRDGSGNSLNKYFKNGQTLASSSYFWTADHIGSVREMVDDSGAVQASYNYDPFGITTQTEGSLDSDFQYVVGYYVHSQSGLNFTQTRAYYARLGRWLNRDLIEEEGGVNLFAYVVNDPISRIDPSGLGPKFRKEDPAPPPYKNCYVGDASCCGYNRNRCYEDCSPCDTNKANAPSGDQGLYPSTKRCQNCCYNNYSSCFAYGQAVRWQLGPIGGWIGYGGHKFEQCSKAAPAPML